MRRTDERLESSPAFIGLINEKMHETPEGKREERGKGLIYSFWSYVAQYIFYDILIINKYGDFRPLSNSRFSISLEPCS